LLSISDDGIVVVRGQKGSFARDIQHVPPALQEQLGPEATLGLVGAINAAGREWKDVVMTAAADRFERRLVEETSKLRVDLSGQKLHTPTTRPGMLARAHGHCPRPRC